MRTNRQNAQNRLKKFTIKATFDTLARFRHVKR